MHTSGARVFSKANVDERKQPSLQLFLGSGPVRSAIWLALTSCAIAAWAEGAPPTSTAANLPSEFSEQAEQRNWTADVIAAESRVREARTKEPVDPNELAGSLAALGTAQLGARNYPAAEAAFTESLQLLEKHTSNLAAPEFLEPLRGLGMTLSGSGRHEQAIPPLERALQVSHRNLGLMDESQQDLRQQLADSLLRIGRALDGERHIQYLQTMSERRHGERDPRVVPALIRVAQWYEGAHNYQAARDMYRSAVDIVEDARGQKSLELVPPLLGLAESFMREAMRSSRDTVPEEIKIKAPPNWPTTLMNVDPRNLSGEGERALRRALRIVEEDPSAPASLRLQTLLKNGDWYLIKHNSRRALQFYATAAQVEGGAQALAFPVRVFYELPGIAVRYADLPPHAADERFVAMTFTVAADGSVENAQITETNASSRHGHLLLQALRNARYRPRLASGEPVATPNMTLREVFKVRKEETSDDE